MSLEHDINCLLTITKATELPSLSGVLLSLCLRAISNRSLHYLSRQEIPVGVTPVPQPSALGQSTLAFARPTIPSKAQAGGGPYQKPAGSVTGRFTTTVSRQNPDETRPNSMGTAPPVHLASGQEPRAAQARFLSPSHPPTTQPWVGIKGLHMLVCTKPKPTMFRYPWYRLPHSIN